jgi:hypothetical protein
MYLFNCNEQPVIKTAQKKLTNVTKETVNI